MRIPMPDETTLLCTFCPSEKLDDTIDDIFAVYDVAFDTVYVLENLDTPGELCCTYNVKMSSQINGKIPEGTISLHRKKLTNTLYTINALNRLVAELNGGRIDKNFKISWEQFRNTILVVAHGSLKKINTKLFKIVNQNEV